MNADKKRSHVLIVDDMCVNRTILSSLLAMNGVSSDVAESGSECIDLYKKNEYNLILLDHRMPEIDGVDTFLKLKDIFQETGKSIPVVCHTTEAGRNNINLYKAAGFADVLIKPIQPKELLQILMNYLPEEDITSQTDEENIIRLQKEIEKLPDFLKNIPAIDVFSGIENCDTADDYLDALSVFRTSISVRSKEIEAFLNEEDYEMLIFKVHSIRSMAKLIGATQLSKEAETIENAGRKNKFSLVKEKTPVMLQNYRAFTKYLSELK